MKKQRRKNEATNEYTKKKNKSVDRISQNGLAQKNLCSCSVNSRKILKTLVCYTKLAREKR